MSAPRYHPHQPPTTCSQRVAPIITAISMILLVCAVVTQQFVEIQLNYDLTPHYNAPGADKQQDTRMPSTVQQYVGFGLFQLCIESTTFVDGLSRAAEACRSNTFGLDVCPTNVGTASDDPNDYAVRVQSARALFILSVCIMAWVCFAQVVYLINRFHWGRGVIVFSIIIAVTIAATGMSIYYKAANNVCGESLCSLTVKSVNSSFADLNGVYDVSDFMWGCNSKGASFYLAIASFVLAALSFALSWNYDSSSATSTHFYRNGSDGVIVTAPIVTTIARHQSIIRGVVIDGVDGLAAPLVVTGDPRAYDSVSSIDVAAGNTAPTARESEEPGIRAARRGNRSSTSRGREGRDSAGIDDGRGGMPFSGLSINEASDSDDDFADNNKFPYGSHSYVAPPVSGQESS